MKPLLLNITSSIPAYRGMIDDHLDRHQAYADKWGYDHRLEIIDPFTSWKRLDIILAHLKSGQYSHVFSIDGDVFIADFSRDLREMIPDWAFTAFTVHPYPWRAQKVFHIQCGGYSFRACPEAIAFVARILEGRNIFEDDQSAVNLVLLGQEGARWQQGLRLLPCEWNQTIQDCDFRTHPPIIAAFHGTCSPSGDCSPEFRRELMRKVALEYPYKKRGTNPPL